MKQIEMFGCMVDCMKHLGYQYESLLLLADHDLLCMIKNPEEAKRKVCLKCFGGTGAEDGSL